MTLFISFRQSTGPFGGVSRDPSFYQGNGAQPGTLVSLTQERAVAALANRDVVFAVHGFNVNFEQGACTYTRLEGALALPANFLFVGVLWPGDFWIPFVNYPFEGGDAMASGDALAKFCNARLSGVASISFVSHSLGARLVLQAIAGMTKRVRAVCLTAGAINHDCLTREYAAAFAKVDVVSILASCGDNALKLAFPVGDLIGNLLHADHPFFQPALGRAGPPTPVGATAPPWQIPDKPPANAFDHGDYLPPGEPAAPLPANRKYQMVADFAKRTLTGQPRSWPPV